MKIRLLITVAVVGWVACLAAAASETSIAYHHVVLPAALPGEKDLHLYLVSEGEKVIEGFGRGPAYNQMPYDVDASGLRWEAGRLHGLVVVTVIWDGYVPRDGKDFSARLQIDLRHQNTRNTPSNTATDTANETVGKPAAEMASGTYEGTVGDQPRGGKAQASRLSPLPLQKPLRLSLNFEDAIRKTEKAGRKRRVKVTFTTENAKVFAAWLEPIGSLPDVGDTTMAAEHDLRLVGHKLLGRLVAHVRHQNKHDQPNVYQWQLEGLLVGNQVAGRLSGTLNGKPVSPGRFWGEASEARCEPHTADWKLTLYNAIVPNNFIDLYLTTHEGRFLAGFGTTPNFNNAVHAVDVSGLRWEGEKVAGTVAVTVRPDAWVPKDRQPISCRYELTAQVRHGAVQGEFTGECGPTAVRGVCHGVAEPPRPLLPLKRLFFSLENSLSGGSAWHNRALVSLEFDEKGLVRGRVFNNHTRLDGVVEKAQVRLGEDRQLRVEATFRVNPGGGVTAGEYHVTLEGPTVFRYAAGMYEISGPNGHQRRGTFCAYLN